MKKTLLLLFILLSIFPCGADKKYDILPVKEIDANPIGVAFMVAQETDTAKMASILEYYGFMERPSQEDYIVYVHPKGSIIRYSFKDATKAQPYPYVEVKSKLSSKEIDFTLINLGFIKSGTAYERKVNQYARTVFHCTQASGDFLIFHQTRLPLPHEE